MRFTRYNWHDLPPLPTQALSQQLTGIQRTTVKQRQREMMAVKATKTVQDHQGSELPSQLLPSTEEPELQKSQSVQTKVSATPQGLAILGPNAHGKEGDRNWDSFHGWSRVNM